MKTILNLLCFSLSFFAAFSQEQNILALQKSLAAITDSPRYVDALNRISMLSYEENADTTLVYANKAHDIGRRIDYPKGIADATDNLGVYFHINGNLELALRYYSDAHNQYIRLNDSSDIIQTLMNIAMVYNTDGNDDKSIARFNQALSLGATLRQDSIVAMVIYNYILIYPNRFPADSIDASIGKAVRIAEKYHDAPLLLAIGQLKANRFLQAGKRDTAIRLLQQSLAGAMREKLFYMSLDLLGQLGDLYRQTDSAKAVFNYQQALSITKEKNYLSYEMDITNRLSGFYSAKKDKARMLEYSTALVQLYKDREKVVSQSGVDYIGYALKDEELSAIRERSTYQHRLLWLESIAFILVAAIAILLWRNAGKSRRTNATLREQYEKLANTTTALETSNNNYARLIRVVAHDLRNPIGAIGSITDKMVHDSATPAKEKEGLRLIDNASKRCMRLISELLESDFSIRPETLHKEPVDLTLLLRQTVLLLAYRANEKEQRLITAAANLPIIHADKEKLARVLDNLIVNAIKFSPESAVINIMADAAPTRVTLSVQDNGVGIPATMKDQLFEPFVNSVRRKGTAGEQSFGLGLYICRQIVEAHEGRIWFESEPGKGSTFFIALPL